MTKNILIVGVGGQGTLLTGRIIGNYAMSKNYDVKMSEVHGMAQRGGSVVMQVKYGDKVYSPLVELGEADIIFAFEKLEALRYMPFLKKDGVVIANTQRIDPMPVVMGAATYPDAILEQLQAACEQTCLIDALAIAEEIGNVKVVNMIMIGAYAAYIGDSLEEWKDIIEKTVPPHTVAMNKEALRRGYEAYLNK
ncbi:indolepyruvate oxidoreductase subunit beta [Sporanaerobium hydrogeniformans]|uniref:Indolepyruvate oxidoreductase subunit beta n=1 Tax=Sporanaerobium hydrogeniformans TaxID=3072179 RepID=A0AC61DCB3_9FIRM|nr:indolepyruvate oxidoreductase subunit beta [Sporanaerobium hydrogeniformans]PHV70934.1 indolepyruvate oxidoreductase subunit beta [Sporanaerobium hydrogeniformans]